MNKPSLLLITLISGVLLAGCTQKNSPQNIRLTKNIDLEQKQDQVQKKDSSMKTINDFEPIEATQATLVTTKGKITFTLFRENAPLTTLNFLNLAKEGLYDGVVFHRVIEDFMAQVGDPLSKDPSKQSQWGTGGPGYTIADEFHPDLVHDKPGILSMANSGPNTGGSQFFITYEPTAWLDGKHAVFGEITSGMEVLEQIEIGDKIISISYQ
jgi:cyclophilin family peptidyl-prolyl cis-trans isomerase